MLSPEQVRDILSDFKPISDAMSTIEERNEYIGLPPSVLRMVAGYIELIGHVNSKAAVMAALEIGVALGRAQGPLDRTEPEPADEAEDANEKDTSESEEARPVSGLEALAVLLGGRHVPLPGGGVHVVEVDLAELFGRR